MGQGMAGRLLAAGHDLLVCNRTPEKAQSLVAAGASWAATPREAAAGADLIVSMVGDDDDSRAVWLGPDGVLAGRPEPGTIAVECTTLSLAWVRKLSSRLTAAGLGYIDCPVTGGRPGASAGTLTLLVGADPVVLQRARPVLDAMSSRIEHFGPPGAGTAYKLTVNLMVGVQAAALAEGLRLAEEYGLDRQQVVEAFGRGAAASPVVKSYAPRMAAREYAQVQGFSLRWMAKDLRYAMEMARDLGQETPVLAAAEDLFEIALCGTRTEKDIVFVIEALSKPSD